MAAQGPKHANDHTTQDTKRERLSGAAGRAAALRRAPSDSDCSGETASLSADSAERRPAPPPPRSGKTRSRRRGSEWEVLEGLKDGQRFERRPDVFNGYLHKKRKWPLKGWHKRFFVVDGGILVYARSPTDVARGRLHGSLDVGLSVISAKPRRRRIDIDADEFIYHLRAKTPDVFRTWLNVLKAHRLYRQHLLTFGARESVPKIHAPLDEIAPTETSSHISHSSNESFSSVSSTSQSNLIPPLTGSPTFHLPSSKVASSVYENKSHTILKDWKVTKKTSSLLPFEFESIDVDQLETKFEIPPIIKHGSLCSMCCVEKRIQNTLKQDPPFVPLNLNEKQMHSSNLDLRGLRSPDSNYESQESPNISLIVEGSKCMEPYSEKSHSIEPNLNSSLLGEYTLNTGLKGSKVSPINVKYSKNPLVSLQSFCKEKSPILFGDKTKTAMFCFGRKKRSVNMEEQWMMKRSRKSTNLCKYRNSIQEPPLKRPFSKCMLLGKYKLDAPLSLDNRTKETKQNRSVICDILPKDCTQVKIAQENKCIQDSIGPTENKSIQDIITASECDNITEKLILTLFDKNSSFVRNLNISRRDSNETDAKFLVNEAVKELYHVEMAQCESQPIKYLFKSLLHFWLKNTGSEILKNTLLQSRSTDRQSFQCYTKDAQLSSEFIKSEAKETQVFEKNIEIVKWENKAFNLKAKSPGNMFKTEKKESPDPDESSKPDTDSFEKERRIQELERLLKNTVYICETVRSSQSREKDIKITKTLIQNLDKFSKKSVQANVSDDREISDSSAEIPRMQETINRLISETDLPPDLAKEFLNAYLDVLLHNSSQSATSTSQSSENSKLFNKIGDGLPIGDVQAEAVQRKVSKSITTTTFDKVERPSLNGDDQNKSPSVDPGQLYLKDMLDKITSIFSRVQKVDSKLQQSVKDNNAHEKKETPAINKTERSSNNNSNRELIYENKDDNSVVIDLSKFDLDHISMVNDATTTEISITIKLKEKPADFGEWKRKNLSLKFSNDRPKPSANNSVPWPVQITTSGSKQTKSQINSYINMKNPYIEVDPTFPKDLIEIKPYLSTSDATSKANCESLQQSDSSLSFKNSDVFTRLSPSKSNGYDDAQCYLLSSFKKVVPEVNIQDSKKMRLNQINVPLKTRQRAPDKNRKHPGMTVFEKAPPRIIDEKFILLLLENLTLLSKNIPGIYKDINSLYLKLRKRHEKIIKNSSFAPGLSLLGKIYNEESGHNLRKPMFDEITQYDVTICPEEKKDCVKDAVPIAVNTSLLIPTIPNVIDKSLSAYELSKTLASLEVQTESCFKNKQINNTLISKKLSAEKSIQTQTSFASLETIMNEPLATAERAVSIQKWYRKLTEESAMSTVIKCLFEKDDLTQNFRIAPPESKVRNPHEELIAPKKSFKKQSAKVRQDLIKEIKLLSPSFKVSTQSQTMDKKALRHLHCLVKDFKVYKMETSNFSYVTRSGSVTESNVPPNIAKSDDLKTLYRCTSNPSFCSGLISPTAPPIRGPQAGFVSGTPGGRLASWIIESGGPLESASRELGQAQLSVQQLQRLLDALEIQQMHHDTDVSLEGASPNVKKDRRKFGLRKKKSNSKCASIELAPPHVDTSTSHMALSTLTAPPSPGGVSSSMPNSAASLPIACAAARPQSLPGAEALGTGGPASLTSLTPDHQLREDFTVLAKDLVASLKTIVSTLVCERGRLRAAMDAGDAVAPPAAVAALRTNLSSALQQNSELRSRLSRIHDASDLAEISSVGNNSDQQAARPFPQSNSYSSSCVSASEFFDAEEHEDELKPAEIITTDEAGVIELDGDSSSEAGSLSSEEGSASSDNSDGATSAVLPASRRLPNGGEARSRRARLPCPRPTPASPSLWNLLYKNIGKDLSQISMPVTINEPLNMLQRLCEELEYSELLDAAAECGNELDRMSLIAAFAVSAYAASAHRAASKPFNPLLAETYECVRPDRDFRFIAEQVSHHPPISACHAESPRWTFWQEARIKTKFWGKSMEFQPTGRVHVRLARTGDHYSWNKVTTCVHNLFGGQRWVDQYGDMHIVCHGTDITCKLNFIKASSWSSGRHEVRGAVLVGGQSRARLAGRWSEGLHAGERPLWRPGAMPQDYELYYGFTRFAMELNELEPGMREILPHTDTRLRPDQRALEEGDVDAAEQFKHELEQAQRERRRDGLEHRAAWFRKTVEDGEETWVFTGEYWKAREAGFSDAPRLW